MQPPLQAHSRNSVGAALGPARGRIPQRVLMGGMISYQRMSQAQPAVAFTAPLLSGQDRTIDRAQDRACSSQFDACLYGSTEECMAWSDLDLHIRDRLRI